MIVYHVEIDVFTLDCPEVFTLGVHWEHALTKTTNTHKCSDIHPSFKLTDVITRECLRNRTWASVNISRCVMDNDSPVVIIVIVSLDTTDISLVRSKEDTIIQQVCCILYIIIIIVWLNCTNKYQTYVYFKVNKAY